MEEYVKRYEEWCTNPYFDADTQAELKKQQESDQTDTAKPNRIGSNRGADPTTGRDT